MNSERLSKPARTEWIPDGSHTERQAVARIMGPDRPPSGNLPAKTMMESIAREEGIIDKDRAAEPARSHPQTAPTTPVIEIEAEVEAAPNPNPNPE